MVGTCCEEVLQAAEQVLIFTVVGAGESCLVHFLLNELRATRVGTVLRGEDESAAVEDFFRVCEDGRHAPGCEFGLFLTRYQAGWRELVRITRKNDCTDFVLRSDRPQEFGDGGSASFLVGMVRGAVVSNLGAICGFGSCGEDICLVQSKAHSLSELLIELLLAFTAVSGLRICLNSFGSQLKKAVCHLVLTIYSSPSDRCLG